MIYMSLPRCRRCVIFLGCPVRAGREKHDTMNGSNSSDKTDRVYSLALLMTWSDSGGQRSRSQKHISWIFHHHIGLLDVEGVHVDAGASKFIF